MRNKKILVAQALKAKGLKGEIKLKYYVENIFAINKYILVDESEVIYEIANTYFVKNFIIVKFKGIDNKEAAESIIGKRFYTYRKDLPDLQTGYYYIIDLIGLDLLNNNKEIIGKIIAAHNFGAGDIIEVKIGNKTFMIPFNEETILEVDLQKGVVLISESYKEYM